MTLQYFSPHATPAALKQRYRQLARRYHPDHNPTEDGRKFTAMSAEYERIKSGYQSQPTKLAKASPARPDQTDPIKAMLVVSAFAIQSPPLPRGASVWVVGWRVWVRGIARGDMATRRRLEGRGYCWDELREGFWREVEGEQREYAGVGWMELLGMYQCGTYRAARM